MWIFRKREGKKGLDPVDPNYNDKSPFNPRVQLVSRLFVDDRTSDGRIS